MILLQHQSILKKNSKILKKYYKHREKELKSLLTVLLSFSGLCILMLKYNQAY